MLIQKDKIPKETVKVHLKTSQYFLRRTSCDIFSLSSVLKSIRAFWIKIKIEINISQDKRIGIYELSEDKIKLQVTSAYNILQPFPILEIGNLVPCRSKKKL